MGSVAIFSGNFAKTLKANLNLFDAAFLLTGSQDPRVTATLAPKGSLLLRQGAVGEVYYKLDAGSTTNWRLLVGTNSTAFADEFKENLRNVLDESYFDALAYNIPRIDGNGKLDVASTATYDPATDSFRFTGVGQTVLSTALLDTDFLSSGKDVDAAQFVNKWVLGLVNTTAVYQASRDGGAHWQTVAMERISNSNDTYQGQVDFDTEQDTANQSFATVAGNLELGNVATINERFGQQFELLTPTTLTQASLRLSKVDVGGLAGNYRLSLVAAETTATQLTQGNATLTTTDFSTPTNGYLGQSFTTPVGLPKFIKTLTLFLKSASITEHAPLRVGLMNLQAGVPQPNTVQLADTILYTDEIPAGYTAYTFTWNTPVRLQPNTQYAFVIQDYKTAGTISAKGNLTDTFAGGNLFSLDGDGVATQFATFDLAEWSLGYETRTYLPGSGVIAVGSYALASGLTTSAAEYLFSVNQLLAAGVYYIIIDTDAAYKTAFTAGQRSVRVHGNLATGDSTAAREDGGIWSAITSGKFAYNSYGTIDTINPTIYNQVSEQAAIFNTPANSISRAQRFNSTTQKVVSRIGIIFNKAGNPTGSFRVRLVKDSGANVPSTLAADTLWTGPYENLETVFDGVRYYYPNVVISSGLHHVVIEGDAAYEAQYTGTRRFGTRQLNGLSPSGGASQFNGTVWSQTIDSDLYLTVDARVLDLRYRVTASSGEISGYGALFDRPAGSVSSGTKLLETFNFTSGATTTFALTKFLPDPDLLVAYLAQTGQAFRYPAFDIQGQSIVFPANAFGGAGQGVALTLVFDQTRGGSFDNADRNASLLAANHLGSTDTTLDRSAPGRGVYLRRPDGTLVEVTVDNSNNIAIYSI